MSYIPYRSYSNEPGERAKALLCHYFTVASGRDLDQDCYSEIGDIVDNIIQAVKQND